MIHFMIYINQVKLKKINFAIFIVEYHWYDRINSWKNNRIQQKWLTTLKCELSFSNTNLNNFLTTYVKLFSYLK